MASKKLTAFFCSLKNCGTAQFLLPTTQAKPEAGQAKNKKLLASRFVSLEVTCDVFVFVEEY